MSNHKAPNRAANPERRNYTVRLDEKLLDKLHNAAKKDGRSLNSFIVSRLVAVA